MREANANAVRISRRRVVSPDLQGLRRAVAYTRDGEEDPNRGDSSPRMVADAIVSDLRRAVETLAGVCDGASTQDGQGFNRFDSEFGHSLARANNWTPKQARAAWKMTRKYRRQLEAVGIDWNAIPAPPRPEAVERIAAEAAEKRTPQPFVIVERVGEAVTVRFDVDEIQHRGMKIGVQLSSLSGALKSRCPTNRRFDRETGLWTVETTVENLEGLIAFVESFADGSAISPRALRSMLAQARNEVRKIEEKAETLRSLSGAADSEFEVQGLGGTLRPFQRAGVAYATRCAIPGRVIIADEPGLGKTIEALATLQSFGSFPALVVCPANAVQMWQAKAREWLPGKRVERVSVNAEIFPDADVYVINYDVLFVAKGRRGAGRKKGGSDNSVSLRPALRTLADRIGAVVFDESHYLKNPKALRTKAARKLAKNAAVRLLLTGTPAKSRPIELVPQLEILGVFKTLFQSWHHYATRYCGAYRTRYGWDVRGATNTQELHEVLTGSCYIRRRKNDVVGELPPKQRATIQLPVTNLAEYRAAHDDIVRYVGEEAERDAEFRQSIAHLEPDERRRKTAEYRASKEKKAKLAESLVRLGKLKRIAARGKLDAATAWLRDFIESGEKIVVFAYHRDVIEDVASAFGDAAVTITGDNSAVAGDIEKRFQEDESVRILVGQIQAAGVALTLTAASNVAFVELGKTSTDHDQAEDRCHRIGQRDSVTAWYLLAEGTIEVDVAELMDERRAVTDSIHDGREGASGRGIMQALLQRISAA